MTCEEMDHLAIDYLDGILAPSLIQEAEFHLKTCERCRDEYSDLQLVLHKFSVHRIEQPDSSLELNFDFMLQTEIEKLNRLKHQVKKPQKTRLLMSLRVAAGIALLLAAAFLGYWLRLQSSNADSRQARVFKQSLQGGSPGERIKVVSDVDLKAFKDPKLVDILIGVLNCDDNVNVRLAAVFSLSGLIGDPSVRQALILSLEQQTEPVVQIALINILTETREPQLAAPLEKLINNQNTPDRVKYSAEKSLQVVL